MSGFDLFASVQSARGQDGEAVLGGLDSKLAVLSARGATELAAGLSTAVAQLPGLSTGEGSGRHRNVIGLATFERAATWQATAIHAVLDGETGVLSVVAVAAVHTGSASGKVIEAALAEAIGAAFNWTDGLPNELSTALGYPGSDQGTPSIIDVPEIGVTVLQGSAATTYDDAIEVAQISMVMALLDTLATAGCRAPLPLPIAPDLVLRQLD